MPRIILSLSALLTAPLTVTADVTFTPLLVEGQSIPGVGLVTLINNVAINNAGQWVVECDTDDPNPDTDNVLVRNGAPYLREGDALVAPAGTTINSFDAITLNNAGLSGWNFFLGNAPTGADSGLFLGEALVLQESTFSTAPQLSPDTPYIGFFEVKISDDNELMVMASIDDPAIPSTVDRALLRIAVNPDGGIVSESVLAKEGDVLPDQSEPIFDFLTGPHNFAFNNAGQTMYVADLTGDTAADMAIYIDLTRVAQEGQPAPVAGRNWAGLGSTSVDVNDIGQYVHNGALDGDLDSNAIIVKTGGAIVRQEGDPYGSAVFTGFGTAPVLINNQGRVLWYGAWSDPDTTRNEGLFLDDELIVLEGFTTIDGIVVQTIRSGQDAFAMSDSGRFIVFEAVLADGREGAFQITLSYCPGNLNGDPNNDLSDLAILLSIFGACNGSLAYMPFADFDFDGCIGLSDLALLLSQFGTQCPV